MKKVNSWYLPDTEEHLLKYILKDDSYQGDLRKHALGYVTSFRTAVDIGAHVGLWARDLAKKFNRVVAFEPIKEHYLCFLKNVTEGNVALVPLALSNLEDKALNFCIERSSTGGTRVAAGEGKYISTTLDSFQLDDVDFIKIDCEGYEYYVLKGAVQTILRCRPVINIEQKERTYKEIDRYYACGYLESLGMKLLGNKKDEFVYGF